MQDKTITNALLQLRAQIIRGRLDGLDHVEALLWGRGVDLARVPKPHAANSLPRLAMRRLLLDALRDGPKGGVAAARYVAEHQPDISYREAQRRVHQALTRMVATGFAVKDGGVWRLADSHCALTVLRLPHDGADYQARGKAGARFASPA